MLIPHDPEPNLSPFYGNEALQYNTEERWEDLQDSQLLYVVCERGAVGLALMCLLFLL